MVKTNKEIIIDGKAHLIGRLASVVAKQLREGHRITVLRCEDLNISGKHIRNKRKYLDFLRKKSNTNPRKHSHIHYRAPSMIFWRTVRGMLKHKSGWGADCLKRFKVADGVPVKYHEKPRVVCEKALTHLRLKNDTPITRLGSLASEVGWKHEANVKLLEDRRKAAGKESFLKRNSMKKELAAKRESAMKSAPQDVKDALALIGM